jgi:hypothetical protein
VIVLPVLAALHGPSRRRLRRLVPLVPLPISALFVFSYVVAQLSLFVLPALSTLKAGAFEQARIVDGPFGDYVAWAIVAVYPLGRKPFSEVQELVMALLVALTAWTIFKAASRTAEAPLRQAIVEKRHSVGAARG